MVVGIETRIPAVLDNGAFTMLRQCLFGALWPSAGLG